MAATARAAKAPAKTRRPAVPARYKPPVTEDDDEVIDLGDPAAEADTEREPLFSIAGTVHTMLKNPGPSIALRAMELAERRGATELSVGLADVYIMREMLGETSYRALLNCRTMTREQYLKIVGKVMRTAMGALEDEDGSPNR